MNRYRQKTTEAVTPDAVIGDRKCMVYSGTLVVSGTANGCGCKTGMDTELVKHPTCLTKQLI